MERTLILRTTQGETVTEAEALCFARQLLRDLKSDHPKINWKHDISNWSTFVSTGLSGTSLIKLSTYQVFKDPVIQMSYQKDGKFIYNIQEFQGSPANPKHLAHLYKWVAATVKHSCIYGTVAIKDSCAYPSIEETDDQCLKIIELFNSLSVSQIEDRLMNQPSILTLNASAGSPEWHRRCKMIRNLVKLIQGARIKESPYLIDGFSIKDCNGKLCGHIATDPIAKWANAHVIVRKEQYSGLQPDEIRLKVASDLIANLLLDM